MNSGEHLFAVMYVVNALLALASLIAIEVFLRRLRRSEPQVHKDLGEPLVFTNNTGLNTLRAVGFLFLRRYRGLPDASVRKLGSFALAVLLFTLAVGGITALYFSVFPGAPSI